MEEKNKRGGRRIGAGRPKNPNNDRHIKLTVMLSQEAIDYLSTHGNKSEFIDKLIRSYKTYSTPIGKD